jgi:6-pyruvoyltetrahydropterin/6-carboxytetrahydropterin synthase
MITATRYHDISCGHRVYQHEGKCQHLHGHNYRIYFTVKAPHIDKIGRVIDFGIIRELLCVWLESNWDHKFLVYEKDPWYMLMYAFDQTVVPVPFNPTAENMAKHLVQVVGPHELRGFDVDLIECTVEETRKCSATFTKYK